jgi:hypothetical protein
VLNKILNSEELILLYIKENNKEYCKKIKYICSIEKRKKREVYYVNT